MRPCPPVCVGIAPRLRRACALGLAGLILTGSALAAATSSGEAWIRPVPPSPTPPPAKAAPAKPEEPLPPTQNVPLGARPLLGPPVVRESSPFEIDAPDMASAQTVLRMAQALPGLMAKFFPWPEMPPSLVQIELVPAAQVEFVGPYLITTDRTGHCMALVRWGPDTKLSDVCQAIGQASLKSLAAWRDGPDAVAKTPDWLGLALGKFLEVGVKSPLIEELSQDGEALFQHGQTVPSLRQLMITPGPYGDAEPVLTVYAYWLLRFLNDQCRTQAQAEALFSSLAAGMAPVQALTAAFPDEFDDPRDLELWWQVGYRDFVRAHATPAQTIAQSRAQLDQLEYVLLLDKDGNPQRTRLDQAWDGRTDKTVREAIANELLAGRSLPVEANPIYHNATLSLLTAVEMLHGDDQKKFTDAWAAYLADRAAAEIIASGVEAALLGN